MADSVVVIRGADNLTQLGKKPGATEVVLFGCHIDSLEGVEKLPKLRVLKVIGSTVKDVSALADCPALEELELIYSRAEDASPLLKMPSLRRAKLFGNPWSKASFEGVRAKLADSSVKKWKRPAVVEWDDEGLWETNRRLAEVGLDVAGASFLTEGMWFVRPGLADGKLTCFTEILYVIDDALKGKKKVSFDELKKAMPDAEMESAKEWERFDAMAMYTVGDQTDAMEWLKASKLPKEYKADLTRFLKAFPKQLFVKHGPAVLDQVEKRLKVKLPGWYRMTREQVVASVYPHLSDFEGLRSENWLRFGPIGYTNNERRVLYGDKAGLFPLAETEEGSYGQGFKLKYPDALGMFEYYEESMNSMVKKGRPVTAYAGAESYAALLAGIAAIKVNGREVAAR